MSLLAACHKPLQAYRVIGVWCPECGDERAESNLLVLPGCSFRLPTYNLLPYSLCAGGGGTSSVPTGSPAHRTTTSVPHTHTRTHTCMARAPPPACSGVSTQVLAVPRLVHNVQCVQRKRALLSRTYAKLSRGESGGVRGGVGIGLTPPAILRSTISASDRGECESSR